MVTFRLRSLTYLLQVIISSYFIYSASASNDSEWINRVEGNCFTEHLREAIEVNRTRKILYSTLTNGKSKSISNQLIALDRIGVFFAPHFDARSRLISGPHGVPLLCEVIPTIMPVLDQTIVVRKKGDILSFRPFSASLASQKIWKAFHTAGLPRMLSELYLLEAELAENSRFNCLARQFIRSMRRLLEVTQGSSSDDARELALDVIQLTLLQLRLLVQIDRQAAPLQAEGIPILCAENPELPRL